MMDFQDNISDFKSTSLDLLYNQVSSLIASYNELKASGEINDVFEKRLLLLQKTIGSMKSLIQNVEEFNDLDEYVTEEDVTFDDKDNSVTSVSNSEENNESVNDSGLVFNDPLISDSVGNATPVVDDSSVSTQVISGPTVPVDDTKSVGSSVSDAIKGSLIFSAPVKDEVPVSPVETATTDAPAVVEEASITHVPVTVEVEPSVTATENSNVIDSTQVADSTSVNSADINIRAIANLEKFHRISSSPVKAIIVNENQFSKLSDSLSTQAGQLDFGVSTSDSNMSVEEMLEKANNLYNSGDRQAAEKLYDQINSMTLVKKTA